jgi:hypothetical protein
MSRAIYVRVGKETCCSASLGAGATFVSIPVMTILAIPMTTTTLVPVSNMPIVGKIDATTIYPQISHRPAAGVGEQYHIHAVVCFFAFPLFFRERIILF